MAKAAGRTINIPLPPGSNDSGYLEAFERVICPIAHQFAPELVLISAGQDPNMANPLGRMLVTMDGFRGWPPRAQGDRSSELRRAPGRAAGRRLQRCRYVPFCTLAAIEGLVGERSAVVDPYEGSSELVRSKLEYRPV